MILKAMSQSVTWKKQKVTDPEWLDSTNEFIRGCNERLDNVKDLLLYLAPKLSSDDPVPIKLEEQDWLAYWDIGQLNIINREEKYHSF